MADGARMPLARGPRLSTKVCLVGEDSVGKTSLIRRFVDNAYDDLPVRATSGEVWTTSITVPYGPAKEAELEFAIVDIRPPAADVVAETQFQGCNGLVPVCDVTRKETLVAVHGWLSVATSVAGDVPSILVVNKMDLAGRQRTVSEDAVVRVARTWSMPTTYASAKTGSGVGDAFRTLAIAIVDRAWRKGPPDTAGGNRGGA